MTAAALLGIAMVLGTAVPAPAAPAPDAAAVGTAEAVRGFGAPRVVIGGCGPAYAGAGGVVTADGSARGFATCLSTFGPIRFYDRAGDGTVRPSEGTGFTGEVLAVTADATATYLLYRNQRTLFVGKRTNAGAYSSRLVSTISDQSFGADLIARDGQWLGVWSRPIGGGDSQTELYEAGTGLPGVRRITVTGPSLYDLEPTLAYDGATPVLVWSRLDAISGQGDLRIAERVGIAWRSRTLSAVGEWNYSPDVAVVGGLTVVAWVRDGRVVVASDSGGAFASRRFAIGGFQPKVGVSTTAGGAVDAVFVAYPAGYAGQPFFAETREPGGSVLGTWSGRYLNPPSGTGEYWPPVAVGGVGGRATVTYRTDSTVLTIRQV